VPAPRVILAVLLTAAATTACGGASATASRAPTITTSPSASSSSASSTSPTGAPPTTSQTSSPTALPSGLASPFGEDLAAEDVPLPELVPARTEPTGSWIARIATGDAIVVAWEAPSDDPFRTDRGVVVWRHTGDPVALWRPVSAATYRADRHPVLGITATINDVTGDGSPDALVFAETGGSGACGIYLVVDPSTGAQVYRRSVCDTAITPSSDPVGLMVTEAVYAHGDPHCCPSAMRTTILRFEADGAWTTVSETTTPT
jgi:hypothetical protein